MMQNNLIVKPPVNMVEAFLKTVLFRLLIEEKETTIPLNSTEEYHPDHGQDAYLLFFEKKCREYNITERQKEIIYLTFECLESKEIAGLLKISPRTVENHFSNIYEKTKARNKLALVRLMFYFMEAGKAAHFFRCE